MGNQTPTEMRVPWRPREEKKESLYLTGQLIDGMECLSGKRQLVYDAI